jgi:predicted amidohydrolase
VAQTVPKPGDVAGNLAQHLELARLAARRSARVLVFPELSLTGYELELGPELAFDERDARLAPLIEFATRARMTLIVGAPLCLEGKLQIGAFILGGDGAVQVYAKQHLGAFPAHVNPGGRVPPAEGSLFVAGTRTPLFELDGTTAAIAVCADVGQPSHAQLAAAGGATCYFCSMFVIPSDFAEERARLAEYARQYSMIVAFANYGGPSGGLPSAGQSAIWSERGELLVELPTAGAGIALCERSSNATHTERILLDDDASGAR